MNLKNYNIFFYHKDHLGSSTQISDMGQHVVHHIEYLPTGFLFAEQSYYTPEIGIWLSVDPLSDKYPSMSAFMYCAGNPVIYIDPDGRDIDETTSGYEQAKNAADPSHASYQPEFAKLFNDLKENESINVQFISDMSESDAPNAAGTIGYDKEKDAYQVFWDSSDEVTNALGTSAMFEEAKHLDDGLNGKFDIKNKFKGFGIEHEVSAKQWVVNNIIGIKDRYTEDNTRKPTHYGFFKNNPNELTAHGLGMGIEVQGTTSSGFKRGNLYGTGGNAYRSLYRKSLLNQAKMFLPQNIIK